MKPSYSLKTYGCKLNRAESGELEQFLSTNFEKAPEEEADFIVINSCGIVDKTERKINKKIKELKKKDKFVVVTGCLPSINKEVLKKADLIQKGNSPELLKEKLNNFFPTEKKISKEIPVRKEPNSASAIVSVATGCLGSCSYCSAKLARGKLSSYPLKRIMEAIKKLVAREDVSELQLTAQDLGVWGADKGTNLPDLLKEIADLEEDFKVKLGMINPGFLKQYVDEFLEIFESEKFYDFLHIPVQSGSNRILNRMNRKYTKEEYKELIEKIKDKRKNLLLSTDVIVGFPGETEDDFNKTIDLVKDLRPHIINITRYSERKNTKAEKMEDMPSKIKKERSRKLTEISKNIRIEDNKKIVGEKFDCLIFREGKGDSKLGRIPCGKATVLKKGRVGEKLKVKITNFKHNYLIGELI